jgi:ATP-binding protein involved in chromosome partitioning
MNTEATIRECLAGVLDPELGASIVELGMVGAVRVDGTRVEVEVALTTVGCPLRAQIERDVAGAVRSLEGIDEVDVVTSVMDADAKRELLSRARLIAREKAPTTSIPAHSPILMIASGKGGVGKSVVTARLARALATRGLSVGVLDADIWGFSLSRLLGIEGEVTAVGGRMIPLEQRVGAGRIRLLSMGLLADEDQALLWRGLIVQKAVAQFIEDADWSGCDYLVIDTPPGTGDIAMTLARLLPRMGQIVVTTPDPGATRVAARAADFARKSHVRVLGVIENMSGSHSRDGERFAPFGEGGGQSLAESLAVPLLCQIPLDAAVPAVGDTSDATTAIFDDLAERVISDVAPPLGASGCSARLLEALESATRDA